MAAKRITYGDIYQLLEAEGFQSTPDSDTHLRFDHASSQAAVILPKKRHTLAATSMNLSLLRHTMVDYGLLTEAEYEKWAEDPKHFQAA